MHLNLDDAVTAAGLTPTALHIKAETSFVIALRLGIRRRRKQVADHIKHARVSCRVRTRSTADRGLVNVDDLIQLLQSLDLLKFARNSTRTVQLSCQFLIKDFVDQGTFSRAGDTGHAGHNAKWEGNIDIF